MTLTTQKISSDGYGEALDYKQLTEPWREWAAIASNFIWQLDKHWDREDLMHNIIVRCAEVAEVYRQRGIPFNKGAVIKTAEYTRLRFYRDKKRLKRVYSISLNSMVQDSEGNETELVNTLLAKEGIDRDEWLDFKNYYQSRPDKEKGTIHKLVMNGEGHGSLSGYDWKLIKRFRTVYKEKVLA